ncbi:hypothetical protein NA56DRAFT_702801 [Hyaloscypha hepaticicola]|uniref:Uncharacterized protein n=1 Tax=Hyaloscypha hepaticicola TaxID=2082293 RepID=A0A2J6Q6J8_9HELO|nr:hypothetical protein NA56DRAFT_702801 [Hyaloscypha hepaticicola]
MPFRNWQEKRSSILILAAASITIMLFTVVHLRHFLPRRHHDPVPQFINPAKNTGLLPQRDEYIPLAGSQFGISSVGNGESMSSPLQARN